MVTAGVTVMAADMTTVTVIVDSASRMGDA